jgi:hypothetical protein
MGGIASIAGGLIGASSAKRAANAQANAAAQDLAFQRETRDLIFDRMDPFYQPGITAQNALAFELGLGGRPMVNGVAPQIEEFTTTMSMGAPAPVAPQGGDGNGMAILNMAARAQPTSQTRFRVGGQEFGTREEAQAFANANPMGGQAYQGFQATPGFQFALDQGNNSINALAGARGGLNSGRTLQDLSTFNMGMANQEYGNFLNRLTGMSGQGFAAAGAQANAATNAAQGTSNALAGIGNAQAAGAIGQGNAWTGALNNLTALNQYQRGVNGNTGGGGLFGGNSWGR